MEIKRIDLVGEIKNFKEPGEGKLGDERDILARLVGTMLRKKHRDADYWRYWNDIGHPFRKEETPDYYIIRWTDAPAYLTKPVWSINTLLKTPKYIIIGGEDYKIKDGVSSKDIYDFIMKHIDALGEIKDWDEARIMKELADYPVSVKVVKGRMVELCYHPVSSWCGDEFRSGDCVRTAVDENTICEKMVYTRDMSKEEEKAEEKLIKMIAEKFYQKYPVHEIKINKEKFHRAVTKRAKEWIEEAVASIKEGYSYKKVMDALESMSKGVMTCDNLTYSIWFKYSNFWPYVSNPFVEGVAVEMVRREMKERIEEVYSSVEGYEVEIPLRRGGSATFYLFLPKGGNTFTAPDRYKGLIIGKGGENIKALAREIGRKYLKIVD